MYRAVCEGRRDWREETNNYEWDACRLQERPTLGVAQDLPAAPADRDRDLNLLNGLPLTSCSSCPSSHLNLNSCDILTPYVNANTALKSRSCLFIYAASEHAITSLKKFIAAMSLISDPECVRSHLSTAS